MSTPRRLKRRGASRGSRLRLPQATTHNFEHDPPIFALHYLDPRSFGLAQCEARQKVSVLDTLYRLSRQTWSQLLQSDHRHGGYERLPRDKIVAPIPVHVTDDVQRFYVFRSGNEGRLVGYRVDQTLVILWIDFKFRLYPHE